MSNTLIHRRAVLAGALACAALPAPVRAAARIVVYKDPNCGCCGAWAARMTAAGFSVETRIETRMNLIKARHGVPDDLVSCHTALVEGYVIEGHVPAEAIAKLLAERPKLAGLSVPGMPVGSPGMEVAGEKPDPFRVIGFAPGAAPIVFADYPRGYRPG